MSSDNQVSQLRSSTQYDSDTFFAQGPSPHGDQHIIIVYTRGATEVV